MFSFPEDYLTAMSRKTFGDAGKYWFQMSMMSWTNISYIHNCIDTSYWYINLNKHQWWFDQKPLMIWRNISVLTIVLIKASCSNIDLNKHKQGFDQRSTMIWSNINNDLSKYQWWFDQIYIVCSQLYWGPACRHLLSDWVAVDTAPYHRPTTQCIFVQLILVWTNINIGLNKYQYLLDQI